MTDKPGCQPTLVPHVYAPLGHRNAQAACTLDGPSPKGYHNAANRQLPPPNKQFCPRVQWFWYLKKTLRLFDQLPQYKAKVNVYLSMNVLYSFGLPASHWWSSDWRCQTHNECHIHMPPNPEMPLSPKNKLKENAHYNQVVYSTTSVVFLF